MTRLVGAVALVAGVAALALVDSYATVALVLGLLCSVSGFFCLVCSGAG